MSRDSRLVQERKQDPENTYGADRPRPRCSDFAGASLVCAWRRPMGCCQAGLSAKVQMSLAWDLSWLVEQVKTFWSLVRRSL